MYIRSIELTDLRAFKSGKLEFLYPSRKLAKDPFECPERSELADPRYANVNVVLGTNGSGKSTILDAIALALLSPIPQNGFVPNALIRRSNRGQPRLAKAKLELILHAIDSNQGEGAKSWRDSLECVVERQHDYEYLRGPETGDLRFSELFRDRSPGFTMLGYGVFRRVEAVNQSELLASRQKRRSPRYDRVATLFEDDVPLIPLSSWFPTIPSGERRDEIVNLINKVTPKTVRFEGRTSSEGEMIFKYRNLELPFAALSDGYRGHLGWIGDMLYRIQDVAPVGMRLADMPGVILVDEIDAHLHPGWQQEIIGALSKTFPKLQFILTTHSPLITGTLERANINLVTRHGSRPPVVEPPRLEMYGLSSDQILRTDLFGLESTRDESFARELRSLQQRAVGGGAKEAIEFMQKSAIGKAADLAAPSDGVEAPDWLLEMARETQ
jgi:energy-coupling factor transporter ATP-binding protein EcfA2